MSSVIIRPNMFVYEPSGLTDIETKPLDKFFKDLYEYKMFQSVQELRHDLDTTMRNIHNRYNVHIKFRIDYDYQTQSAITIIELGENYNLTMSLYLPNY